MFFRLTFLSSTLAIAIVAPACDKPSSISPPATPQIRPHDQSADNIVALLMALRKDKKDAPEREAYEGGRAEMPGVKPFAAPAKHENG